MIEELETRAQLEARAVVSLNGLLYITVRTFRAYCKIDVIKFV